MFSFLQVGGEWRPFFGGDRVELELDAGSWVPRRMTVSGPSRTRSRKTFSLVSWASAENPSID
jgi:hypothetical protein